MWQVLRSLSDTLGVGFLSMQLIKLVGMAFALIGPLKFVSDLFSGLFPLIAGFFSFHFGWKINGLDIMAVSIAASGTLIVASSVATRGAMETKYFWRFLLIPYAFFVIVLAIVVQISTPIVELFGFTDACAAQAAEASFYGSSCADMTAQLRFFGVGEASDAATAADDDLSGLSFILAMLYLVFVLPAVAILIFFFKRLSVNRLLKRVAIAIGSALGLVIASTGIAVATGQMDTGPDAPVEAPAQIDVQE